MRKLSSKRITRQTTKLYRPLVNLREEQGSLQTFLTILSMFLFLTSGFIFGLYAGYALDDLRIDSSITTNFIDFANNPKSFVNKTITVEGKIHSKTSFKTKHHMELVILTDKHGFEIPVATKYDRLWTKNETYRFTGKVIKDKSFMCLEILGNCNEYVILREN